MKIDRIKLIAEMAKLNVTILRLSEMAGVSRATISAIRSGKACSPATAAKLAKALNVSVDKITELE